MRWTTRLALIGLLGSIAPAAAAQARPADADDREVMAYRLTLRELKQLTQYHADLGKQMNADPAYQTFIKNSKELAALREKDELTDAEQERLDKLNAQVELDGEESAESSQLSLSALSATLVADPRAAAALKRAGLTPREAATMLYAFMGAYGLAEMMKLYNRKAIPEGVNVENVKFCQARSVELGAMIESWAPMEAQGVHFGAQQVRSFPPAADRPRVMARWPRLPTVAARQLAAPTSPSALFGAPQRAAPTRSPALVVRSDEHED